MLSEKDFYWSGLQHKRSNQWKQALDLAMDLLVQSK
jgi:hypothetical protein